MRQPLNRPAHGLGGESAEPDTKAIKPDQLPAYEAKYIMKALGRESLPTHPAYRPTCRRLISFMSHFLPIIRQCNVHSVCLAVLIASVAAGSACAEDRMHEGEAIYLTKCMQCHGKNGAGTSEYDSRLEGDLSIAELATLIHETMPADDPGTVSSDQAEAVATYVHDTFYSAVARARNQSVRVELARLTVDQYRRALADLICGFPPAPNWEGGQGLSGEYYSSREPQGLQSSVAARVDPTVDFDFGTEAPLPEISEPRTFSIRWEGSILAPESGEFEFIVRTEHALRLWINDNRQPAIDAWVKSGNDTEYRVSRHLIGGRIYPLRLEFTKAKQGVDDSQTQKVKPPSAPASIALLWRRPTGEPEVIPARYLSPKSAPESFVSTTPFPPDDRSYGWVRGTTISPAWDEATTHAALEAADYVGAHLNSLAGTRDDAINREVRLRLFCRNFVERAFRRPLDDNVAETYVNRQFAATDDLGTAVRRVVLLTLKSPRFLFREVGDDGPQYDVASRLSFGLWDSVPDRELLSAAQSGQLASDEELRGEAQRMLEDQRAKAKLHGFLLTWLNLDTPADLSKDPEAFPGFDAAVIADLRTSLGLFLDEVLASEAADWRQLLLDDGIYVNARLAKFYGIEWDGGADFAKVRLDDGKRAGVLSHPFVLARYAHYRESSPIHRGVLLARGVLGLSLRPPPQAFAPLPPELHPDLSTRERVTLQTSAAECMTCHRIINPLGFTLEQFDAAGRFRELDRGKPVDAAVVYQTGDSGSVKLEGARQLAEYLAGSAECRTAFTEQMFHHLVGQSVRAYGPETLRRLCQTFVENKFNIRKLAVEIMVASARTGRDTKPAGEVARQSGPDQSQLSDLRPAVDRSIQ
jgi:cytochrome c553